MPAETINKTTLGALPEAQAVAKAIDKLDAALDTMFKAADERLKSDAVTIARMFVVMHRVNSKLEELHRSSDTLGKFGKAYARWKQELVPQALEAAGITHVPLAEGFRVGVSEQTYVSIQKDMKDKAYDWLRRNKLGDLITSTINSSTLSAAIRKMIEDDNKEPPADLFKVTPVANTSVTVTK